MAPAHAQRAWAGPSFAMPALTHGEGAAEVNSSAAPDQGVKRARFQLHVFPDSDSEAPCRAQGPAPATADAEGVAPENRPQVLVFRICHKDPASLKRPLAAVDNLRSGDVAVKDIFC